MNVNMSDINTCFINFIDEEISKTIELLNNLPTNERSINIIKKIHSLTTIRLEYTKCFIPNEFINLDIENKCECCGNCNNN